MSSVVRLTPRENPTPCSLLSLTRVAQAAFGQRRKMLRQSLKSLGVDVAALLDHAGVGETLRAEAIPVDAYVDLANAFDDLSRRAQLTSN